MTGLRRLLARFICAIVGHRLPARFRSVTVCTRCFEFIETQERM